MGLVSYYHGADKELFAGKTIHVEDLSMTKEHLETYRHNENIENKLNRMSRGSNNNYMSMTRASCNFVFPYINNKINGDLRPKASKFRINTKVTIQITFFWFYSKEFITIHRFIFFWFFNFYKFSKMKFFIINSRRPLKLMY